MRNFQAVPATTVLLATILLVMFSASACGSGPTPEATKISEPTGEVAIATEVSGAKFMDFDPGNFSNPTNITNKWLPLRPGSKAVFEGNALDDEGNKFTHRIESVVTDLTKEIGGVRTVVVWIVDYRDGEIIEKEIAFYAQDDDGNVWYFGEYPEEYENGEFVQAVPWIHGIEEASAGVKMVAEPQLGMPIYYQGWGPAVDWSDYGQVDQTGQEICVPVDCYKDVLVIAETSLGETNSFQLKYYAPDVGRIRVGWKGEDPNQEELEVVERVRLNPEELAELRAIALELEAHAYEISKDVYAHTSPAEQTPAASSSPEASPTPQASPTPEQKPLLTGQATMCDTGANLISFRIADPAPDLTGKTLTVEIAGQERACAVNPGNQSLITCTMPSDLTFPARVAVSLDGAVVNDFTFDGVGCDKITTPVATTTP